MKEQWKSIRGYDGLYEVSDMGRVRSLNYNHTGEVRLLALKITRDGYYAVCLWKKGEKRKEFLVHRLVVTAFIGPIPKGMVVNHLNEDKLDNRLSNLEVCSVKENNNWGTRNERAGKSLKCNSNASKKLQLTNAKSCAKYTFSSSCDASEFFGFKNKTRIGNYIYQARKRNGTFINIKGEKYYFSQET